MIAPLDRVRERGSPIMANRVLASVRKFFNWCIGRGILEVSPCSGITAPAREQSRHRVPTDEIAQTTEMTLGIRMRPHDFHRCAAVTAAFRGSDMPHRASGVLQHRNRRVTDEHYNRTSSMQAGIKFAEMVSGIRS